MQTVLTGDGLGLLLQHTLMLCRTLHPYPQPGPWPPLLPQLIEVTRTDLSKADRQKVMNCITIDAHSRDVVQVQWLGSCSWRVPG